MARAATTASAPEWSSARPPAWSPTGPGGAGTREHDPWSPDALVWPLLAVVDAHAGEDWCRVLSQHLGHGEAGEEGELRRGRRYAVARRLAQLFASYAVQRPTLLEEWEQARDTDGAGEPLDPDLAWQPELWRLLVAEVGAPSPRERHRGVLAALRERPGDIDLPDRFSLFGHTRIPVTEVELLGALGEHRDVHVWLPHPSDALWQASLDLTGVVPRAEDSSHARVGHPLLASLGRDGRELERALVAVASGDGPFETGPDGPPQGPGASLLSLLQGDIAANATVDPSTRALAPADHSVQVHACHGPSRQVEVLREVLLGLLSDDPTLEPRDILVMCPDIESYAPLIEAAFGMGQAVAGGHPGQQLQVRLADRALTQTNPLLAVVGKLLDLAGGRAEASTVLDLVASEPVRRRFGLADSDLETITGWVEQAGIRWAYDAEHRDAVPPRGVRPEHLALRRRPGAGGGRDVRRRGALDRHDAAARRRRLHQHRSRGASRRAPRPAAARHRPADRQPPRRRLARRAARGHRRAHLGGARRGVADRPGPARALGARRRRPAPRCRARAQAPGRPRADGRAPGRAADPGQLPHRHVDGVHDGPDALGAPPGGLPARPRRRRLPAGVGGRR